VENASYIISYRRFLLISSMPVTELQLLEVWPKIHIRLKIGATLGRLFGHGFCLSPFLVVRKGNRDLRLTKTRRRLVLGCDAMVVAINVTGMNCGSSKCFVLHLVCRHRLIERTLRRVLASSPAVFHVFSVCTKCDGVKVGLSDEFDARF